MTKITPNSIRQKVLSERGITSFRPELRKRSRLHHVPQPVIPRKLKTPLMRYLELVHGEPIERMLVLGSLSVVAKKLDNEVAVSTISKWIKKLKLRYTVDNLPQCEGCPTYGPACDGGVCLILVELELYSLIMLKKAEMFEEPSHNGSVRKD